MKRREEMVLVRGEGKGSVHFNVNNGIITKKSAELRIGILDNVAERYAELRIVSTYCTEIAGLDVCRFIIRQYFGNMPIRNSAVFSPTNGVFNLFCPLVVVDILLESGPELSWDIVE